MSSHLIETSYYTEGPVIDQQGVIFVTNLLGQQVLRVEDCQSTMEWASCSSPNGQFIASNGDHYICNSLKGSIERYDARGVYLGTFFKGTVDGYQVSCPNDLWIGEEGLFFTDSIRHTGAVVFIASNGMAKLIARDLDYPNGIVYDKKRNCLYVAESYKNRIIKINLSSTKQPISCLVNLPAHPSGEITKNLPDGLCLEDEDMLWIAHYGMGKVHCYDLKREALQSYESGITLTSNIFVNQDAIVITGGEGEPGPGRIRIIDRKKHAEFKKLSSL